MFGKRNTSNISAKYLQIVCRLLFNEGWFYKSKLGPMRFLLSIFSQENDNRKIQAERMEKRRLEYLKAKEKRGKCLKIIKY